MATTSLNIVQRLGGPTSTTLLQRPSWDGRLGMAQSSASLSNAFTAALSSYSADCTLFCLLPP